MVVDPLRVHVDETLPTGCQRALPMLAWRDTLCTMSASRSTRKQGIGRRASSTRRAGQAPKAENDPAVQKLSIYSLEGPRVVVTAMFNPKEISVDKSVPWTKSPSSKSDSPQLEFSSADGRVMSFELMFDGFESGTNVHTAFVDSLVRLACIQDPNGPEDKKRPPRVGVKWGTGRLPEFQGVIESVGTKYTLFLPDGTPVRATCQVRVRETSRASVAKT